MGKRLAGPIGSARYAMAICRHCVPGSIKATLSLRGGALGDSFVVD